MSDKELLDDDVVISANVISIGDFSLKRADKKPFESCKHIHLVYDDEQHQIECADCKQIIENYMAFKSIVEKWNRLQNKIDSQKRLVDAAMEKTVNLRAAQKVESAWRSKSMVPACPHCHEPIFSTDGFCGHMVNKQIALRRRAAAEIGKATSPQTNQQIAPTSAI